LILQERNEESPDSSRAVRNQSLDSSREE